MHCCIGIIGIEEGSPPKRNKNKTENPCGAFESPYHENPPYCAHTAPYHTSLELVHLRACQNNRVASPSHGTRPMISVRLFPAAIAEVASAGTPVIRQYYSRLTQFHFSFLSVDQVRREGGRIEERWDSVLTRCDCSHLASLP